MKKSEFLARIEKTKAKAKTENVFQKPKKGLNSGMVGELFEMSWKAYLNYINGALITKQGKVDSYSQKKHLHIEYKQGCSPLNIFDECHVDYVVYSPDFMPDDDITYVSFIMSAEKFLSILRQCNLIRMNKKMSDGTTKKAIQSYKNSKRKYNMFLDLLYEYNEFTADEFKAFLKSDN